MKLEFDIKNERIHITAETNFEKDYLEQTDFIHHRVTLSKRGNTEDVKLIIQKKGA